MRPIFTIHSGEYLVGTHIEEDFPHLRVWIPSRDTGVDLLVTDSRQNKVASLQVKFSKDYLASSNSSSEMPEIESGGWWKLSADKMASSEADYWVFVLYQFHTRKFDFVVVPPRALLARYERIGAHSNPIQTYFSVTRQARCWETRGLGKADLQLVCSGSYANVARDFTEFLNVWPFAASGA